MGPGIEPKIKQDSLILHLNMYIECKYQLNMLQYNNFSVHVFAHCQLIITLLILSLIFLSLKQMFKGFFSKQQNTKIKNLEPLYYNLLFTSCMIG